MGSKFVIAQTSENSNFYRLVSQTIDACKLIVGYANGFAEIRVILSFVNTYYLSLVELFTKIFNVMKFNLSINNLIKSK